MDDETFLKLYYDTTLRVPDIAAAMGKSVETVGKRIKKLGLPSRLAIPWRPPVGMSPELAYLLGAWITDGTLLAKNRGIALMNTNSAFIDECARCADLAELHKIHFLTRPPRGKGLQDTLWCTINSTDFGNWIDSAFGRHKLRIASIVFSSSKDSIVRFLSAIIDGNGHVDRNGCIRLRGSFPWIEQVPELCSLVGIRCTLPYLTEMLPSGKAYKGLSIRRTDFLAAGGRCVIESKQQRLIHPEKRIS